ncbi:MFS transporter [Halomonas litopenaei]|uniref:MFS transporter n=1 Tax=Halomonas litopenaei TaxID=2109328 RepID=A0ABX5IW03_9GAMM|nr:MULTISPECIES: MFS transporter [Halomonas]MAR73459.1 MFS transporter [Halomonas sp.]MBS8267317.1 MFS transporter [Halomonas litopenaei]MBY5941021.1 MFS transporter [Halomonas sp. DP5N14-9]PTL90733.1 MFS transporter [Halomonas sp. SYSU XM8]PTL93327.1 MFS transporter [Halomonas litopenaei]
MLQHDTVPRRQQNRALGLSTLAFTLCFAVWTLFSILGIQIKEDFALSDTQLGLLMATPVLTGSISRLFLGVLTDRFGGRWVFGLLMLVTATCVYLLTFANSYVMLLVGALGIGLAGGSFIVGVAYTSAWFEKERQGTALGIFGAGNVGAAVTNFGAPFLLMAMGWKSTALVYATIMAIMGVAFILLAKEDPQNQSRNAVRLPLSEQFAPLADLRVWRFSLYYFFVFGGFVALALWLPHYLIEVYGLSLSAAGIVAALYTIPASLFRILGGWMSDRYGARRVMYWTFLASVICTFLLSYPPTQYVVDGVRGPVEFTFAMPLVGFILLTMVLGFFMSLGKAAVYKHIPVYYPKSVGLVGGAVGMVGGLGGFFLPLTFGMLNDVIGIWQSCFMLMFVVVAAALMWMHFAIRKAERIEARDRCESTDLPELSTPSRFVLEDWRPEDESFWQSTGRKIATRNLWISIPCLLLAFCIWMVWSMVVAKLPQVGFEYTPNQLFWLAALPGLSGATLRIFYSFTVPIFGGRRFTAISTASLLLPALWIGFAVQNPETPYLVMAIIALLCGFGGGNFASSMANIAFFYPKREKGKALAMNAGLGNLGVSVMQFLVPVVISTGSFVMFTGSGQPMSDTDLLWLQNAGFVWVPFIAIATVAAWFGMNDIASAKSSFKEQSVIFKRKHNWLMCILYTGTFGSFIGFSAGFPLLTKTQFPAIDALQYAFLGPFVGALSRAWTGGLADRFGGARVTFWTFLTMIGGVIGVLFFLMNKDMSIAFYGFFASFMLLFFATGVGNASTFQMIPSIFRKEVPRLMPNLTAAEQLVHAERESAATIGFTSAIAAYGAFLIPKSFGTSISLTGGAEAALIGFIVFYVFCTALTWFYYSRKGAEIELNLDAGPTRKPSAGAAQTQH